MSQNPTANENKNESITIPQVLAEADFQPKAHDVKGKAVLIDDGGNRIIRFQDFETINGPDLFGYQLI